MCSNKGIYCIDNAMLVIVNFVLDLPVDKLTTGDAVSILPVYQTSIYIRGNASVESMHKQKANVLINFQ
ncbi:protein of unknown function [Shewanella benthica]|uniref:Uncharacterized protein n=1 Tax=Shewanella benthica TaxID=43661 RepID=A0A330LW25_9GAMM|nr:protein of unknown function [Shewanella benthica]